MQTQSRSLFWRHPWRWLGWGFVTTLLMSPLIAMQFTTEVNWTLTDFVVAAILLGGTALCIEFACHSTRHAKGRLGWALLVLTSLLLIWINLAVGIIGHEGNPANLVYIVVLASVVIGACWVGGQPQAMARVLWLTAALQIAVEIYFQLAALGAAPVINLAFAFLWLLASALLRHADSTTSSPKPRTTA